MRRYGSIVAVVSVIVAMTTFSQSADTKTSSQSKMQKRTFGTADDGLAVDLYVLRNKSGMEVAITNYGGAVVSLKVPDRAGKFADVVLGYDNAQGYVSDKAYFGGII